MIPKVNGSPILKLVPEARSAENDPGSSQGSGVAYENAPPPEKEASATPGPEAAEGAAEAPPLRLLPPLEAIGMSEVVREFHEHKKEREPHSGLSVRYQPGSGNAKGLLLNRKAE